jgi:O-antigen/teichoic acid export membrane protein
MTLTRKIIHNTLYQILGRGIGLFFSLISLGLITRYLGQAGFGYYTTIFAFLQLFTILADFGLTLMAVQMISEITEDKKENAVKEAKLPIGSLASGGELQEKTNNIFSNIFTLRLVLAFVLLGLAPIVVWFFPYPAEIKYGVLISSAGFLFASLMQILQSVFQKNLQMHKLAIADVFSKFLFLASVYLVTIKDWNLYGVLLFMVLTHLLHFIAMLYLSREFVKVHLIIQLSVWREILKRSWPIALSIAFNLIYLKADILILSLYFKQELVGLYGAAYRAIDVLTVFPYLFVGLILPLLSAAWAQQNKKKFNQILQKSFDALAIVAAPLVVGTIFLAEPIMALIAGQEFSSSGAILRILIIALGMIYLSNIFSHSIIAIHKQKQMMWGYLFTAATSLVGYFIFIPRYSYWGAAGVTLYSEVLVAILTFSMVVKTVKQWPKFTVLFKSIIASSAMGLLLWLTAGLNLFIVVPLAVIVYFGVMLLVKGVDLGFVREIVSLEK